MSREPYNPTWGDCAECKRRAGVGDPIFAHGEWREEFEEFLCGTCYFDKNGRGEPSEGPDPGGSSAMS